MSTRELSRRRKAFDIVEFPVRGTDRSRLEKVVEKHNRTYQHEVSKDVGLPHPSKVVRTNFSCVLGIKVWCCNGSQRFCRELCKARDPVDALEAGNTRVTDEM